MNLCCLGDAVRYRLAQQRVELLEAWIRERDPDADVLDPNYLTEAERRAS